MSALIHYSERERERDIPIKITKKCAGLVSARRNADVHYQPLDTYTNLEGNDDDDDDDVATAAADATPTNYVCNYLLMLCRPVRGGVDDLEES